MSDHYLNAYQESIDLDILKNLSKERESWWQLPPYLPLKKAIDLLKKLPPAQNVDLNRPAPLLGKAEELNDQQKKLLLHIAKELIPWKKGPFEIFDQYIDAEWRSDLKWERLFPFLPALEGKKIIDIGCNNGYFMLKMAPQNPKLLLGIDPVIPCLAQFQFLQHFAQLPQMHLELWGVEHLSHFRDFFDVIFHMGIIYHHRHPIAQMEDIKKSLTKGGVAFIETIGIPGDNSIALFPEDRYAKMRNIWFVPTLPCLINWAKKAKFKEIDIVSDTKLTNEEQRTTAWCRAGAPSLEDFLNPNDPSETIEGHPAPRRFCIRVKK